MDITSINNIIVRETEALEKLLSLLEEQHDLLARNDVLALEEIVKKISLCNKEVAEAEVERRKLVNGDSMKTIIEEFNNSELDENYRKLIKVLHELEVQKETNDMLIKMGLSYSTRLLNIINPDRTTKTYNSYGKLKR